MSILITTVKLVESELFRLHACGRKARFTLVLPRPEERYCTVDDKRKNADYDHELDDDGKLLHQMHDKLTEIAQHLHRLHIADYLTLLNRPMRLITSNLISGISRGIGIAIGFTIFAGTIIYILKWLGALDLPVIGNYISSIVDYVQRDVAFRAYNR